MSPSLRPEVISILLSSDRPVSTVASRQPSGRTVPPTMVLSVFFAALSLTISQLRGENIDTPVLVLAEHATARSRIRLLDAGADNVLPYPCISGEILARRVPQMQREIITAGDLTLVRRRLREIGSQAVIRAESGIGYYIQPA